jgi:hypothetical protein
MTARRFTITANGAAVPADGGEVFFNCNGRATYSIRGAFGGGTLKIQGKLYKYYNDSLSVDADYTDISNSPDYVLNSTIDSVEATPNVQYRFNLTGATAPNLIIDVEIG